MLKNGFYQITVESELYQLQFLRNSVKPLQHNKVTCSSEQCALIISTLPYIVDLQ